MSAPVVAARAAAVRSPARAGIRRPAARRPARPPRPLVPEDFFSDEAHKLLTELLVTRAERWQTDGAPPLYFYARDSEPLWGDVARHRCSGTTLRIARQRTLCECLCIDLERGLRLLTLVWAPEDKTADGHTTQEWRAALAGVCWRVGQLYREFTRRKGEDKARDIVRLAMDTLWW